MNALHCTDGDTNTLPVIDAGNYVDRTEVELTNRVVKDTGIQAEGKTGNQEPGTSL